MKSLFEKYTWLRIVAGIVLLLAGVLAVVLSITCDENVIARVIGIIVAICCFIYAAMLITASFIKNPRTPFPQEVLIAGIAIGVGITLCIGEVAENLAKYATYLLACGLISLGTIAIIKSIVIICYKDPVQNWLIMIICGTIALVGGILLLCFRSELTMAINIVIGCVIAALGILEIILGISFISKNKKSKKKEEKVVDQQ